MSDYKYKSPKEMGYKQFKLNRKQHNKLFPKRKRGLGVKYEYYYNEHNIRMDKFGDLFVVILNTVLFPLLVLLHGVSNFKEICKDVGSLYKQKKLGSFSSYHVHGNTNKYKQIMEIVKGK